MAAPRDLTTRLAVLADDLGPVLAPVDVRRQLTDHCALMRVSLGAASVSVARLDGGELVYEAADGVGADVMVGTRLSTARGIAGYAARTGQSLVVDQVQADPRFARDVAERSGHVPTSMLVVPVMSDDDVVTGIISVLDRTAGTGDPLAVASTAARLVAPLLATVDAAVRLGPLLLQALADAVQSDERDLAPALRRLAARLPEPDDELARLAALVAEMRALPHSSQATIERVLRELIALAAPRRRR